MRSHAHVSREGFDNEVPGGLRRPLTPPLQGGEGGIGFPARATLRRHRGLGMALLGLALGLSLAPPPARAMGLKKKKPQPTENGLQQYIERAKTVKSTTPTTGSLWTGQSPYSDLASDYKAHNINDLVVIQIVESTSAAEDGAVKTSRSFSANSGVSMMGTPGLTSGLLNLFTPTSNQALNGSGQTSSNATLSTSLSGRVVDVLPNGFLAIEAERQVFMNNQHQTVVVHGVIRPGDITSSNTVPSTAVSNLEVELKGKGVISDGTAPPNKLVRTILKLVGF